MWENRPKWDSDSNLFHEFNHQKSKQNSYGSQVCLDAKETWKCQTAACDGQCFKGAELYVSVVEEERLHVLMSAFFKGTDC